MPALELVAEQSECLDPGSVNELLTAALAEHAPISFYRDAARSRLVVSTQLVERTRTYLELLGPPCDDHEPPGKLSELASALLVHDKQRFTFMAVLERIGKRQGRSYWRIETPSDIRPLIRRSPRLRPRSSTGVTVRPIHGPDVSIAASLLNVSEDGMACRVPAAADDGITRERMVKVSFRLAESGEAFELAADVVHRQAAGTDGFDIVGLQFCRRRSAKETLRRLADALARMAS